MIERFCRFRHKSSSAKDKNLWLSWLAHGVWSWLAWSFFVFVFLTGLRQSCVCISAAQTLEVYSFVRHNVIRWLCRGLFVCKSTRVLVVWVTECLSECTVRNIDWLSVYHLGNCQLHHVRHLHYYLSHLQNCGPNMGGQSLGFLHRILFVTLWSVEAALVILAKLPKQLQQEICSPELPICPMCEGFFFPLFFFFRSHSLWCSPCCPLCFLLSCPCPSTSTVRLSSRSGMVSTNRYSVYCLMALSTATSGFAWSMYKVDSSDCKVQCVCVYPRL